METQLEYWEAHALLAWQVEMGVSDAIGDAPVDRYELAAPKPAAPAATSLAPAPAPKVEVDAVAEATAAAKGSADLDALRAAMAAYPHCDLRRGARNLVFSDGNPAARVMIVGEAPGRDEDIQGRPFVGRAGQLLDAMFAAIGLARGAALPEEALYITNTLPWRPPENRDPLPMEIEMMTPFLLRHIELAQPEVVVLVGNWACTALLGEKGITRLRGKWREVLGRPAMPMLHPAYLLRMPAMKREAWADLLEIKAHLDAKG